MQRAALYVRVSTEEQAMHGDSIRAQKPALVEYATQNNYFIVDQYIDEGQSARKPYSKRAEFVRLLDDIKQNKIDIILFTKLDRWFRNVADYYKIQEVLDRHKVVWKATQENYDTTTASGRLNLNIKLSIAQDEADRTSERIKFVFADKVRRGEAISGNMPFGLIIENKKVVPDPVKAPIIKDLFEHYLVCQGKRTTLIYAIDKYKLYLAHHSFSNMLKNTLYTGEYRGVVNYCEPIIDRETYEQIQEVIKKNIKQTKTRTTYVFTGLLICPGCGRRLASAKTKTSEHVYNYHYRCNNHYMQKRCDNNHIFGEKKIEAYLLENIEKEINRCLSEQSVQKQKQVVRSAKAEREKLLKKLEKLKDLYLNDLIDRVAYKADYEKYTQQLAEIKDELPVKQIDVDGLKNFLGLDVKKIYTTLSREEKQALWRGVVKEVKFNQARRPIIIFK